ncbi:MAG: choloylglycine hydrolase [Candidatus Enteromonas sp.]|nr:choloylglycine hydrolase [Candidatus Enteromonas sp.]
MCTAMAFTSASRYFGRNLDFEFSYGESLVFLPRNHRLNFSHVPSSPRHYAMLGMAHLVGDIPLFYDAMNEEGLGIAGLHFVGNAVYLDPQEGKKNVASYELIPYLLSQAKNLDEVRALLKDLCLTNESFSPELPPSPLHYLISDKTSSIVVEFTSSGTQIFDAPVEILTNNPPYPEQMRRLVDIASLSEKQPETLFGKPIPISYYSRGLGAVGLPGDFSSSSRFLRGAFVLTHATKETGELASLSAFFHALASVEQDKGCVEVREGEYEYTIYSSCCDLNKGIYYYKTYFNSQISAVDMNREDKEGTSLRAFPLLEGERIQFQN